MFTPKDKKCGVIRSSTVFTANKMIYGKTHRRFFLYIAPIIRRKHKLSKITMHTIIPQSHKLITSTSFDSALSSGFRLVRAVFNEEMPSLTWLLPLVLFFSELH